MFRYLLALLMLLPFHAPSLLQAKESDQPKTAEVVAYNTRVAKVLEVNQAKGMLALEGEGGVRLNLKVDPAKVKNFNKIKKGDLVKVQTMESLALSLEKARKGEKPSTDEVTVSSTAAKGSMPGAEKVETKQITAEIMKVDSGKSMVELKGPMGNVLDLTVQDSKKLESLKKGDLVSATYTVARAISVEAAPK